MQVAQNDFSQVYVNVRNFYYYLYYLQILLGSTIFYFGENEKEKMFITLEEIIPPIFHPIPTSAFPKKKEKKGINKTRHSLTYTRATLTFTFAGPCKNSGKFAIKETISTGVGSWSKGGTKGRSRYPDIARGNSIPTAFHIYKRGPSFAQRTIFPGRFTSSCTKPNKKERKGRKGRHERNRFEHGYNSVPYLSSWPTVAANP